MSFPEDKVMFGDLFGNLFGTSTPAATGSLSVVLSVPAGVQNLTTQGTAGDWAHWGLTTSESWNHKSGANLIGNHTAVIAAGTRFTPATFGFTWTDGTPDATATNTTTGLYFAGLNNGFTLTIPAGTTEKIFRLFVGAYGGRVKMQAALSDASATDYLNTSFEQQPASEVGKMFEFTYKAAAASQTLLITCTMDTLYQGANSSITLQAAVLV